MEMRQEQRQELTLAQRMEQRLSLHLALLQTLRGEKFKPEGACPGCGKTLKPYEIMQGFRRDTDDTTTKCPRCKTRFQPILKHSDRSGYMEYKFYCPVQTLARLSGKEDISPREFKN